jgi:hypothetical protein
MYDPDLRPGSPLAISTWMSNRREHHHDAAVEPHLRPRGDRGHADAIVEDREGPIKILGSIADLDYSAPGAGKDMCRPRTSGEMPLWDSDSNCMERSIGDRVGESGVGSRQPTDARPCGDAKYFPTLSPRWGAI